MKDVFGGFAEQILRFVTKNANLQFIEHLETQLTTVDIRRMDSLSKVLLDGQTVLVHCEFQRGDSTHRKMELRNVGYLGRIHEQFGVPILSHVIYLGPNAGKNDTGTYFHGIPGYRYLVEYQVIRLIELDGQAVFELQQPGLMPLVPLMRPPAGIDGLEWANQCHEATKALPVDAATRSNLLVAQWVLCGIIHTLESISHFLTEDIMQGSSTYQYIIEQGIERGARKNALESLFDVLDVRFDASAVQAVKPTLERIDDLQRLKQLLRAALQAKSLESFRHTLETE